MIPKIYILTGVHNGLEHTKLFLKSVYRLDYRELVCVIVDDGSKDGTVDYIRWHYPKVKLIHGDGNLWWTGAMEKGINFILKHAGKNDYILTINNDCTFNRDYVNSLVYRAKGNKKVIVGSLVLSKNKKKIVDAGVNINWRRAVFEPVKFSRRVNEQKVDVLSTKGTLFPVKVFYEVGNFDSDKFPHYLSDYEFTCRAKKLGYDLIVNYKSVLVNDSLRTGFEVGRDEKIKISDLSFYLFSRKSKINISDQFRFFYRYCPPLYKFQCFYSLFRKALYKLI